MMDTGLPKIKLLKKFISSIEIDAELVRLFILAAVHGDVSEVIKLLDAGVPVDSINEYGTTALRSAAFFNRTDVVHVLLQKGADVNKQSDRGQTALHHSASNNHTDVIKILLKHGASTTIKDSNGKTPIDRAVNENNEEALLLLQH